MQTKSLTTPPKTRNPTKTGQKLMPNVNNLSRSVPLIGIYKLITSQKLNKIHTITMGHDCVESSAS
jgi:hypothetical protein